MQAHAVMLIAFGSAIAPLVVLCCLCNIISNNNKKQTKHPVAMRTFTAPPVQRAGYGDEKGTRSKDGGMVILARAGAAVAIAAVVASVNGGDLGGSGGCGGGCGGGGCGLGCGG